MRFLFMFWYFAGIVSNVSGQASVIFKAEEAVLSPFIKDSLDKRFLKYKVYQLQDREKLCTVLASAKKVRFELADSGLPARDMDFSTKEAFSPAEPGVQGNLVLTHLNFTLLNSNPGEKLFFMVSVKHNFIMGYYEAGGKRLQIEPLVMALGGLGSLDYLLIYDSKDLIIIPRPCARCELAELIEKAPSRIYPNPSLNENVTLEYRSLGKDIPVNIAIFDDSGKTVFTHSETSGKQGLIKLSIDPDYFPKTGSYIYRVQAGKEISSSRFVVSK